MLYTMLTSDCMFTGASVGKSSMLEIGLKLRKVSPYHSLIFGFFADGTVL